MKRFFLFLVIALFLAAVISFVLGYSNYGVGFGTILMFVGVGLTRYYSASNQDYIYNKRRDNQRKY